MSDLEKVINDLLEVREYIAREGHDLASRKCRMMDKVTDALELLKDQQKQIEQMNFIYGFVYGGQVKEIKELVRCKDCKHRPKEPDWKTFESGFDIEFPDDTKCPCCCSGDGWYSWYPADDWFCADGERR